MLVLSLRKNEEIVFTGAKEGDVIRIEPYQFMFGKRHRGRIYITAPKNVVIKRVKKNANNRQ